MTGVTPRHIGYIVDGNRRWAKEHGLPTFKGHAAGYKVVHKIAQASFDAGVEYVSLYIFSTENWKRSQDEVGKLMNMVIKAAVEDLHIFQENNIKVVILGSRDQLSPKVLEAVESVEANTANNTGGTLAVCFNYGGQQEIVDACKKIVQAGVDVADITPDLISEHLYKPELPPIDIVVRTSGEQRLSNFMLWRSAYSELLFLDKLWPDMTKDDVTSILEEYSRRSRRFGG
ncbi:MAG TPA: polyprenyl diphosphate synthase [Candidatus Saccharimonadales bacterium]